MTKNTMISIKDLMDIAEDPDNQKKIQSELKKAKEDPYIKKFIKENQLSDKDIADSEIVFYEWYSAKYHSDKEKKLIFKDYEPVLKYSNKRVCFYMQPTMSKVQEDNESKREKNIELVGFPDSFKKISQKSLKKNAERREIINYITSVVRKYRNKEDIRGCYLYGEPGTGKTFIMTVLATNLAAVGAKVALVNIPALVSELSSLPSQGEAFKKVQELWDSEFLILDDIGAAGLNSWVRDQIFAIILQHRMDNSLPTFFTSVYSFNELEEQYLIKNYAEDEFKSEYLLYRVKTLAHPILLKKAKSEADKQNILQIS